MTARGTELEPAIALVERELAAIDDETGEWSAENSREYHQRLREAFAHSGARLADAGALCRDEWNGASIRFAGIRSTSTGGLSGALANWLRAARARTGDAA